MVKGEGKVFVERALGEKTLPSVARATGHLQGTSTGVQSVPAFSFVGPAHLWAELSLLQVTHTIKKAII